MITLLLALQLIIPSSSPTLLVYDRHSLLFQINTVSTVEEASKLTYNLYINKVKSPVSGAICVGTTIPPWNCTLVMPDLPDGLSTIHLSYNLNTQESELSTPVYVVNMITKEIQFSEPKCKTGITDATKLAAVVNSRAYVSNILATANAIYVFSCVLE